jgi:hypothetical protein
MGYDVLATLEADIEDIRWTPQEGNDIAHEFCLFARMGFTQSLTEAAAERDDLGYSPSRTSSPRSERTWFVQIW